MQTHDVIIVGGGMVGLTLALALAKQTSLSIAVLEAREESIAWSSDEYQPRVSALSLASERILRALDVWSFIVERRVSPFTQIQVWDHYANGELNFHAQDMAQAKLGVIVENNLVQWALRERVKQCPQITYISPMQLVDLREVDKGVELIDSDAQVWKARLVVGADGAHSWLRQHAKIDVTQTEYYQQAVVATVHTELPHQSIARQVFLETGPLAFLPLASPNACSIVWSLPTIDADYVKNLPSDIFKEKLTSAFGSRLGTVIEVERRYVFPLKAQQIAQYVKPHMAFIGDAAHIVHPLAGQGVNIGILDACSLAEVITDTVKENRDFSALHHLRRYERWRKADNLPMLAGVDALKRLFANDHKAVQFLRHMGLEATNHLGVVKNLFIRHAVGDRADLPRLAL